MKRLLLVLGPTMLFCWVIVMIFPSALTPVLSVSLHDSIIVSVVSAVSLAAALLFLAIAHEDLGPAFSRFATPVCCGVFIISNGILAVFSFTQDTVGFLIYAMVFVSSLAVAYMLIRFAKILLACPDSELSLIISGMLLGAVGCAIIADLFQEYVSVALLISSSLASISLLLSPKGASDDRAKSAKQRKEGHASDSHGISSQGKAWFFLSVSFILFSFFAVYGYNKTVSVRVGAGGTAIHILAILLCAAVAVFLFVAQRKLMRPLLLCSLLGFSIAVDGIIIMLVEPFGAALIPFAALIDQSVFILVFTGIFNLSLIIAKTKVFNETVSLIGFLIPLFLGLALGMALANEYMGAFRLIPFVRIVLLCVLFCPYAFLVSQIHEKENHLFYAAQMQSNALFPPKQTRKKDSPRVVDAPVDSTQEITQKLAKQFLLTLREKEILDYLLRGRDVIFISNDLFISKNTVATHTKHIYQKLDVHSKQELITLAETMGITRGD